ncbi:GNAT family N-acetyltransferase [Paenibacillus sp. FSL L8-0470]|uniref:GNAT family N-acetyltransferase n=1 Tax=unclassified Paenibacillus TaxID=185978 RepID=UPI0030FBBAA8
MSLPVQIRPMTQEDIEMIYEGLFDHDISKPLEYIKSCWEENRSKERVTLLVFLESKLAGWGHVVLHPQYPYFREHGIPEIQNFDIIPPLRKLGIGSLLIEALEKEAFMQSDTIGIGFGLYADYGTAQRMYIKRGFVPDGRGIMYNDMPVVPGSQICVDDDLTLFLIKTKS